MSNRKDRDLLGYGSFQSAIFSAIDSIAESGLTQLKAWQQSRPVVAKFEWQRV